tara:strand:- start:1916 stop:2224 length:309 start_codon:yes stop_codon:yes gene_type:complete
MAFGIGTRIEKEMLETRYFDLLSELPATGQTSLVSEVEKWLRFYERAKLGQERGNAITCNLKIQEIYDVMRKKGFEPKDYEVYKRWKIALDRGTSSGMDLDY